VDDLFGVLGKNPGLLVQDYGTGTPEEIRRRAASGEADAVLYLAGEAGGEIPVRLWLIPGPDDPVRRWALRAEKPPAPGGAAETGILDTPVPWFHFRLPFRSPALAAGDVDGDGAPEILLVDGRRVRIYRLDRNDLREINDFRLPSSARVFALGAVDLDGDGADEIAVTVTEEEGRGLEEGDEPDVLPAGGKSLRVETSLYGFDPTEGFVRRWRSTGLFGRATPGGLYLQGFRSGRGLAGPVETLLWRDGAYIRRPATGLPPGPDIYSLVRAGRNWILYTGDGRLAASDPTGKILWKTEERFGGAEAAVELPAGLGGKDVEIRRRILPPPRKDADPRLVVHRNNLYLEAVPGAGVRSTDIQGLRLEPDRGRPTWAIRNIEARTVDMTTLPDGRVAVLLAPTLGGSRALFGSWAAFKSVGALMIIDPRRHE